MYFLSPKGSNKKYYNYDDPNDEGVPMDNEEEIQNMDTYAIGDTNIDEYGHKN